MYGPEMRVGRTMLPGWRPVGRDLAGVVVDVGDGIDIGRSSRKIGPNMRVRRPMMRRSRPVTRDGVHDDAPAGRGPRWRRSGRRLAARPRIMVGPPKDARPGCAPGPQEGRLEPARWIGEQDQGAGLADPWRGVGDLRPRRRVPGPAAARRRPQGTASARPGPSLLRRHRCPPRGAVPLRLRGADQGGAPPGRAAVVVDAPADRHHLARGQPRRPGRCRYGGGPAAPAAHQRRGYAGPMR